MPKIVIETEGSPNTTFITIDGVRQDRVQGFALYGDMNMITARFEVTKLGANGFPLMDAENKKFLTETLDIYAPKSPP